MDPRLKDVLQHIIPGLSENELEDFASLWTISKTIKKDGYLYPKGIADSNVYLIETGALKTVHKNEDQEIIVGFGYENTFIFDLTSFFTSTPSNFQVQALKSSRLWGISKVDLYHSLQNNLTLAEFWKKKFELLLLNMVEREVVILTNSPKKRYQMLLKRNKTVFQKIPHKYIACYLRMTPETLSRLKKN